LIALGTFVSSRESVINYASMCHHFAMPEAQLHVGTFSPSVLLHLSNLSGGFRRAGLDVRASPVASSPAQFASLDAGEFDVVLTNPDNVLAYRFLSQNPLSRNLPVEILGAIDRGLGLSLCLSPPIDQVDAVRGRVVGVDVAQSGFAFIAYALLDLKGLHPGDYVVEALGSTPRRATALIEETCAATILNAGNELRAEGAGCTTISTVVDIGPYIGTVVAAMKSSESDVIDARRRFTDVLLATANDIVGGEREADVIEAAMTLLNLTETQALAHYACLRAPNTGLIPSGIVDRASIATLISLRQTFMPTSELDTILATLESVVHSERLQ
jgi:hypothetical protein